MMSKCTYTKGYYSTIHQGIDRRTLIVEAIWHSYLVPNTKVEPSIGAISQVVDLHGRQKALWRADQSTLASRGSEGSAMWRNGVWSWDSESLCIFHSRFRDSLNLDFLRFPGFMYNMTNRHVTVTITHVTVICVSPGIVFPAHISLGMRVSPHIYH